MGITDMNLNRTGYLIKEGVKSIFTHGFMSFASVTIIAACLIIMGTFTLLSINVDATIEKYEQENQILAFVDETLSLEEARAIQPRLEAITNVREVQFISNEEAWANFTSEYESDYSSLNAQTVRHRYVVYLDDLAMMKETVVMLEATNGIADVNAHQEIGDGFVMVRNVVSVISIIIIAILLVVSVFIMANTIKLATYSRREEIGIMKMVGAGNFFIRCPFMIEGLILGLLGGLIAFFIEWGLYSVLINKLMGGIVGSFIALVPFSVLGLPLMLVFIAVGLIVGVFGSNIAIRNYLKV